MVRLGTKPKSLQDSFHCTKLSLAALSHCLLYICCYFKHGLKVAVVLLLGSSYSSGRGDSPGISYSQLVPKRQVAVAQGHQEPSRARALGGVRNPTHLQTAEQWKGSKSKHCLLYASLITSPKRGHMLPFCRRNEWCPSQGNSRTKSGLDQVVRCCYPSPTLDSHPTMISGLCGCICPKIEAILVPSRKTEGVNSRGEDSDGI